MHGVTEQFRDDMRAEGIVPPEVIEPDGMLHRFASNGKPGDDAGWYVFHDGDIPAGAFGDWRTGVRRDHWRAEIGRELSPEEKAEHGRRLAAIRREREAEETRRKAEGRRKAQTIWEAAMPAPDDHPYLLAKGVQAHGLRVHDGKLVVPVRDSSELHSLQFIAPDGDKRFLTGGHVGGCYYSIGGKPNGVLCIAEGYATGASIYEATGHAVAVAFNAGNLLPVARRLRERFPDLRLIVCADDDAQTPGNPGLTKARETAQAVGGLLAVPEFGARRSEGATDFNDLSRYAGSNAARDCIGRAEVVTEQYDWWAMKGQDTHAGSPPWPAPLDEGAYHGIAGEIVRMIEPHTEADPVAILAQFLVAIGNLIGRGPHYQVEGDRHGPQLYAVLVGETARGRKGTSWSRIRQLLDMVADRWARDRIVSGLSTAEGLMYAVRDATGDDPGSDDRRLMVVEPEFARALRVAQREGSTLSAVIREAWDRGDLRTLTRHSPITATGTHISIIGHVTRDELLRYLDATETANGYANRYLYLCVRRARRLPDGGGDVDMRDIARRLADIVEDARHIDRIRMDGDARAIWHEVYLGLSEGHPGMLGAVTARAEAQVIRLAVIYALLNGSDIIIADHLRAALAVWTYAEASARYIWGDTLGDQIADDLLRSISEAGPEGMTRTQMRDRYGRHQSSASIGRALNLLAGQGRIHSRRVETGGRPCEVWVIRPAIEPGA